MLKKPTKWGIKVCVCADVPTAYVSTFTVYKGKDNDDEYQGKGLTYRLCINETTTKLFGKTLQSLFR